MKIACIMLSMGLLGASATATAIDLKGAQDKLTGQPTTTAQDSWTPQPASTTGQGTSALTGALGGGSMPAISSGVGGNAAGVLQYCIKNNYLSSDAASGVKDKLMGKVSGQKEQKAGYDKGLTGVLSGSDGKTLDMNSIPSSVRKKGCDYVLSNAKSLI
ncbi:hypothetical protein ARC20_17375 [Stenotrophomonas panacihumi]|uniref:DUF2501 domain-containing protein n=1 Tax=Stenotrophomonas panacihumi TaxID=676599 RepID=A0A0R0AT10_9GAMM|nr:DUF2501 domain-containing protein [Stenotrophomonas panacihumi]KRG48181.1 hypothetical protein ARC20_17375 [Stenotrophomonas panacihumi]PTN54051.1 DUF2501 domain-containing protein [Stenotrophomonas panacihumi]